MNLINVEEFFIIKIPQYNVIIDKLGISLSTVDPTYLSTYILLNLFAYFVLIFIIIIVIKFYRLFFRTGTIKSVFN